MSPTTQKRGIKVDIPPNLEAVLSAAAKNAFVSRTAYVSMVLAQHFGMAGKVHLSYTDSTVKPPPAPAPAVKKMSMEEVLAMWPEDKTPLPKKPLVAWPDEDEEEDYKAAPVTKTPEDIAAFAALLDDDET